MTRVLVGAPRVGVANESDIVDVLKSHHGNEVFPILNTPKTHTLLNLMPQRLAGHVRLTPAIRGDDAPVGFGGVVDDLVDGVEVTGLTRADHGGWIQRGQVVVISS